jgi:hypothetical protein
MCWGAARLASSGYSGPQKGEIMSIAWRHDVDRVLEEAGAQRRPVLIDFTAAPM